MVITSVTAWIRTWALLLWIERRIFAVLLRWPNCLQMLGLFALQASSRRLPKWATTPATVIILSLIQWNWLYYVLIWIRRSKQNQNIIRKFMQGFFKSNVPSRIYVDGFFTVVQKVLTFTFIHLVDAFIQSDIQMRITRHMQHKEQQTLCF